jgi:hypothetical protein
MLSILFFIFSLLVASESEQYLARSAALSSCVANCAVCCAESAGTFQSSPPYDLDVEVVFADSTLARCNSLDVKTYLTRLTLLESEGDLSTFVGSLQGEITIITLNNTAGLMEILWEGCFQYLEEPEAGDGGEKISLPPSRVFLLLLLLLVRLPPFLY